MKIEVVVSDWSGVLSDDRLPVYEADMRLMQHFGLTRIPFDEWLPQTMVNASVVEFMAKHGVRADDKRIFKFYAVFLEQVKTEGIVPTAYPHSKSVLTDLHGKGKRLGVLSAHPEEHLKREAAEYGIDGLLQVILGNSSNKADGLRQLVGHFGCSPSELLYLGDTIFDIRAAKAAGVRSAGIVGGYHSRENLQNENPDHVIELPELARIIT